MFCIMGVREFAGEIKNEAENTEKDPICDRAFYQYNLNEKKDNDEKLIDKGQQKIKRCKKIQDSKLDLKKKCLIKAS